MTGFSESFTFDLVDFGPIEVPKEEIGPFRENFLDDIYLRHIPDHFFKDEDLHIIDIGANVGYFSLAAFAKFPKATIYAFEPHPYCYQVLEKRTGQYSGFNWKIQNLGVGKSDGAIEIFTNTLDSFSSTSGLEEYRGGKHSFTAQITRLDTFLKKADLPSIDFLKVDCEGAEYDILYPMNKEVFKHIRTMCIETHKGKAPSHNIQDLNVYIQSQGYQTYISEDDHLYGYIWAWRD
ncbi:MAG: FkbM family methyltransferase [Bacteroidia bacterium]|nr:FkbM family methyltransferase [Bacteroidia bacterium]